MLSSHFTGGATEAQGGSGFPRECGALRQKGRDHTQPPFSHSAHGFIPTPSTVPAEQKLLSGAHVSQVRGVQSKHDTAADLPHSLGRRAQTGHYNVGEGQKTGREISVLGTCMLGWVAVREDVLQQGMPDLRGEESGKESQVTGVGEVFQAEDPE